MADLNRLKVVLVEQKKDWKMAGGSAWKVNVYYK